MNLCVSDELVIVNIQGIRNVTWGEANYVGSTNVGKPFYMSVTYKGSHNTFYYKTEAEVRSIFNKVRVAMDAAYRNAT
jgi:hypothetical protein